MHTTINFSRPLSCILQQLKNTSLYCVTIFLALALTACQKNNPEKVANNPFKPLFKKKGSYSKARLPYLTLAKVNFESISDPLFDLFLKAKKQNDPSYITKRDVATDELVTLFILAQKARQEKMHTIREVKEHIRYQKIALLARLYLNKIRAEIIVTEKEMQLAHRKLYLEKDNHEYKTRHIVLKTRKSAVAIMRRIANNENFSDLARKYSTGPSASFGGALEWFRPDTVSRKFSATVQRLSKGETSRFPLKTKHGWHIILLEDIKKINPPTLKQVYSRLHEDLKQEKIDIRIKKLRSMSEITINQAQ